MNPRRPDNEQTQGDAFEREWALQERAMRELRAGMPGDGDPELAPYRRIARALNTPPSERLPSNFAWQVAQLAARLPRVSRLDLRLEQWLVRGLVTAMALGGLVVAAVYGAGWLAALDASGTSGHWLLVIGGCVALTWMPDALRQWFGRRGLA